MDDKRKKLRYQSWHRGCKETDDILGPFADRFLPDCDERALVEFAALLEQEDRDIWRWLTGAEPPPDQHRAMLDHILDHQRKRHHG